MVVIHHETRRYLLLFLFTIVFAKAFTFLSCILLCTGMLFSPRSYFVFCLFFSVLSSVLSYKIVFVSSLTFISSRRKRTNAIPEPCVHKQICVISNTLIAYDYISFHFHANNFNWLLHFLFFPLLLACAQIPCGCLCPESKVLRDLFTRAFGALSMKVKTCFAWAFNLKGKKRKRKWWEKKKITRYRANQY